MLLVLHDRSIRRFISSDALLFSYLSSQPLAYSYLVTGLRLIYLTTLVGTPPRPTLGFVRHSHPLSLFPFAMYSTALSHLLGDVSFLGLHPLV
jgi:hypothetical protein